MATALELGPKGWEEYLRGARRRIGETSLDVRGSADRRRLLAALREAATVLKREYGARRVVLFGSLARGQGWPTGSDVDVAVEGLEGDYWEAWRIVEDAVPHHRVDFVEIETASPSLRSAIEAEGSDL